MLLLEYMRVDLKSRANYYDEDNTTITFKKRKVSIKPLLPTKNEDVALKYSRSSEDIVYKIMKLAVLINKFAHLTTSRNLQDELYTVKDNLIERIIDLAQSNPKVRLVSRFDEKKMAKSIVLEIPGYSMLAMHLIDVNESLSKKYSKLEECNHEVITTSTILMPGVNSEFFSSMKSMTKDERIETLLKLNCDTFIKLVIRMGYCSDEIYTLEDRKAFINKIVSDEMLDKLIKKNEEIQSER